MLDGPTRLHVGRWPLEEERTAVRRTPLRGTSLGRAAASAPGPAPRPLPGAPSVGPSGRSTPTGLARPAPEVGLEAEPEVDPLVAWLGEGPALYATLAFCALGLVALGVLAALTVMALAR